MPTYNVSVQLIRHAKGDIKAATSQVSNNGIEFKDMPTALAAITKEPVIAQSWDRIVINVETVN